MKKEIAEESIAELRHAAAGIADELDPDPGHARQVTRLSLRLFDELEPLHHLGGYARVILETAAMLHDTGWARTTTGKHHKHSRNIILESDLPGLGKRDRLMCAVTARYHRKAEPNAERHRRYASMSAKERNIVEWCAAILRFADGLDRGHCDAVKDLKCRIGNDNIKISLDTRGDCETEVWGARRKEGLLRAKTGKELVIKR
jgi:exopolyphosphatase/guanosine-5'-triphosphate,3'-diphosphate pyrophosphatase